MQIKEILIIKNGSENYGVSTEDMFRWIWIFFHRQLLLFVHYLPIFSHRPRFYRQKQRLSLSRWSQKRQLLSRLAQYENNQSQKPGLEQQDKLIFLLEHSARYQDRFSLSEFPFV